jgi:hypothetical protein
MSKFRCKRCGYECSQKQSLKSHLQRKKVCECIYENKEREVLLKELDKKEIIYSCSKCEKVLSTRQNKWKHEKICKYSKDNELKNLQLSNNELKNEILEIKNLLLKNQNNTTNNINNTTNINNIVTNNIINIENLRAFGKENYDYVDEKLIKKISRNRLVLFEFFKYVHFNMNHPENWNFFISNFRSNKVNTFNGIRFELTDKKDTLMTLVKNKREYLEKYLTTLQDSIKTELFEKEKKIDDHDYDSDDEEEEELDEIEKQCSEAKLFLELIEEILEEISNFDSGEIYNRHTEKIINKIAEHAYNKREKLEAVKREYDRINKDKIKINIS